MSLPLPAYDRGRLVPRIVHVGVGGFHRAHLARYTDELAAQGGDWGIRGVGLLPGDAAMAAALEEQDCLYTLVERDGEDSRVAVVGSIVDYVHAAGDKRLLARLVADPAVAILSLTITEAGYAVAGPNPTIEAIVAALEERIRSGARPLTVLSCDNLPGNGDAARAAVLSVAGDALAEPIAGAVSFPNSMVDRITPATTDADRAWLREEHGIDDRWPVVCEPFRQWVLEDSFAAGRPRWEDAGAVFSDRVHDWELYKLRILNAGHLCLAWPLALAGVEYVDEAVALPEVERYLRRLWRTESIPTLREISGSPAEEYAETVLRRFANSGIRDRVERLCLDGEAKLESFVVPIVEAQLERGGPLACAALALAAWSFVEDGVLPERLRASERFREAFEAARGQLAELGPVGALAAAAAA